MQSHKAWLKKAENDLDGARILLKGDINDLAAYHAQQCAEKSLKGFLAFKRCPIQKSHDLVLLAEQCYRYNPAFEEVRPFVETLNPFGTLTRYPSDSPDPSSAITEEAILNAEKVLLFVQKQLRTTESV